MTRIIALALTITASPLLGSLAFAVDGHPKRTLVPSLSDPALYYEMLWSIVVFALFFGALCFGVWPKVLKALQDRETKQKRDLAEAEMAAKQAQSTLKEYQQQLTQAADEAKKVIDQARHDAERVGTQLKDQAQADITQLKQRAEDSIRAAKEQAIGELYAQTATLSTQIAGRILGRELSPQDQEQLVQQSLAEYVKSQN